jgi:hypothetical protein
MPAEAKSRATGKRPSLLCSGGCPSCGFFGTLCGRASGRRSCSDGRRVGCVGGRSIVHGPLVRRTAMNGRVTNMSGRIGPGRRSEGLPPKVITQANWRSS